MAFNGSGVFNRIHNWVTDKASAVPVTASRMDAEMDGFATGLSTCIARDGQSTISAAIPWNSQNLTGVGVLTVTGSTASTSSTTGTVIVTGGVGIGGALFTGGAIKTESTTAATNTTTGSLIAAGGAGIAGAVHVGSTTASTTTGTGSIVTAGGVGVAGRVSADNFRATNQPCFSAHKNGTDQAGITNGTFTKVTLGTEVFDIGSFYDAAQSRWTPPSGMVQITAAAVLYDGLLSDQLAQLSIYKNGVEYKDVSTVIGTLSALNNWIGLNITIIDRANGTDFYELFAFGSTAGTFSVAGPSTLTYFMGFQL